MEFRQNSTTDWVMNIVITIAVAVFTSYLLWQTLMPNVNDIAKNVTVRISGANSGSGVIIQHQGDRYSVLSNWHVVSPTHGAKMQIVQTVDGNKHLVLQQSIVRVADLDLAVLKFNSRIRYRVVAMGNSDRLREGQALYVAGWAEPSPQLLTPAYQFLVGNLSGRIDKPRDGYGLVYTVSALPGMSGGPVLDRRGTLVGIHGRAMTDLRTGTVNAVLGIEIARYLRARGDLPSQGWHK